MTVIAISADPGIPKTVLDKLASKTVLPLLSKNIEPDYLLHIANHGLELRKTDKRSRKPNKPVAAIFVDFVEGKARHRRLQGGGKGQEIARAVGLNKFSHPSVVDLTAGMGGDAFVLASLGAELLMLERNPVCHALLDDALQRANLSADPDLQKIMGRMQLKQEDALNFLDKLDETDYPDVIYIDPMFPERLKSAQVKKEMQFFHEIVGADADSEALLIKAIHKASKRIVVKRPRLAETLTSQIQPSFNIQGKTTRYDVYLPNKNCLNESRNR